MKENVLLSKDNCKYEINVRYTNQTKDPAVVPVQHVHQLDELIIVESGESRIITEESTYKVSAPFAALYPRGLVHCQVNKSKPLYQRWMICYEPDTVRELILSGAPPRTFFIVPLTAEQLSTLRVYASRLHALRKPGAVPTELHARRLLLALILNELSPLIQKYTPINGHKNDIGEICMYISEHFAEELTLDDIAGRFFISRSKLIRSFRNTLDMSVMEYIRTVRISRAKMLLLRGVSIQETAQQCGFSSTEYFIKVFHRTAGVTPAKFRETCEGEQE